MRKYVLTILVLTLAFPFGIPMQAGAAWKPTNTINSCIKVATSTAMLGLTTFTYLQWFYNDGSSPIAGRAIASFEDGGTTQGWQFAVSSGANTNEARFIHQRVTTDLQYITNTNPLASSTRRGWTFAAVVANSGGAAGDLARIYFGRTTTPASQQTLGTTTNGSGAFVTSTATSSLNIVGRSNCNSTGFPVAYSAFVNRVMSLGEIRGWQFNPKVVPGTVAFHAFDYELNPADTTSNDRSGNHVTATASGTTRFRNAPVRMYK